MDIVQEWPKQEVRCYEWAVTKGEGNKQCNNSKDVQSLDRDEIARASSPMGITGRQICIEVQSYGGASR